MAFTIDGVVIPENVPNALTVDGVDIKTVTIDGVSVFNQNLFNGLWVGTSSIDTYGFTVSGNSMTISTGSTVSGTVTVDTNGVFSGVSSGYLAAAAYFTARTLSITGSGNQLVWANTVETGDNSTVALDTVSGFTQVASGTRGLQARGGFSLAYGAGAAVSIN